MTKAWCQVACSVLLAACAGSPETDRATGVAEASATRRTMVRQVPASAWFDPGRVMLNDVGCEQLRRLAEGLRNRTVEVVPMDAGHFVAMGKFTSSRRLARERAAQVAGFLVESCGLRAEDVNVLEQQATPSGADGQRQSGIWIEVRVVGEPR